MNIVENAVEKLKQGEVVALPTETVYGLAASIYNEHALNEIFKIKERPFFDPLIVHVENIDEAKVLTSDWNEMSEVLSKKFWPGPLTLVLPKSNKINDIITSGLNTVAMRLPNHPLTLEVIKKLGHPVAAPSANKFGKTSPTSAEHVKKEFVKENLLVVDGGKCQVGIESTIVSIEKNKKLDRYELCILRKGFITENEIEELLSKTKLNWTWVTDLLAMAPGKMKHHYMPEVPFIICTQRNISKEELLTLIQNKVSQLPIMDEGVKIPHIKGTLKNYAELRLSEDPVIAAREFYSELRKCSNKQCIIYFKLHNNSNPLWKSIFERMEKAATLIL